MVVQEILMTAEGHQELLQELQELKTVRRSEIAEKIKVARGFGDLSENSEYDEAKNEQARTEARILQIEEQLKYVRIVDRDSIPRDVVSIGSRVKFWDCHYEEELECRIVSSVESSQQMDTITDQSPVGRALMGHRVGDTVEVEGPRGKFEVRILEIGV